MSAVSIPDRSSVVADLQDSLASFLGVRHVVITCTGTAALHSMYAAVGITSGDEALVPTVQHELRPRCPATITCAPAHERLHRARAGQRHAGQRDSRAPTCVWQHSLAGHLPAVRSWARIVVRGRSRSLPASQCFMTVAAALANSVGSEAAFKASSISSISGAHRQARAATLGR